MTKIAIIIPTHNRKSYLNIILKQLSQQLTENIKLNIVIVDDGSNDGTIEMIQSKFPEVNIIEGDGTWWYTKSMNEGFKYAQKFKPDFVLTLNDDIQININYVSTLINDFQSLNNSRCVLGSMSISNDNNPKLLFAGVKYYKRNGLKSIYYFKPLISQYETKIYGIKKTLELPGRGILIPNKILIELNYFDELFPQYASDTDFCFRARNKGISVNISWNTFVKVNLSTTRIRSQSGFNSYKIKLNDLFNRHSHHSLKKFIAFQSRHYPVVNMLWKVPYFIVNHFLK